MSCNVSTNFIEKSQIEVQRFKATEGKKTRYRIQITIKFQYQWKSQRTHTTKLERK